MKRLEGFKWILVDQVCDLTIAAESIRSHISSDEFAPGNLWTMGYIRMCTTALIISLCKLHEAFDYYGKEIHTFPSEVKKDIKKVKEEIENRKIYQFRSKYAAHVINKKTKLPLSIDEGNQRYKDIIGEKCK